jgi:hypothetical protein
MLMRHSDPKLTANIYTRLELHDGREAVARIDLGAAGTRTGTAKGAGRRARAAR